MTTPITTTTELEALPEAYQFSIETYGEAVACAAATVLLAVTDGGHSQPPTPQSRWQALTAAMALTPAPTVKPGREAVMCALGNVLSNVSNFPRAAQPRLLGQDMGPLMSKTADAVLAILPGKTEQEVRAEALRDAKGRIALDITFSGHEVVAWLDRLADEDAGK